MTKRQGRRTSKASDNTEALEPQPQRQEIEVFEGLELPIPETRPTIAEHKARMRLMFADDLPAIKRGSGTGSPVTIEPRGLLIIEELAARGRTQATVAAWLGIDSHTLMRAKRRDLHVAEAFRRGFARFEDDLSTILMSKARNPHDRGGTTAAIYLSKSRAGWREGELPESSGVTQIAAESVTINMPPRLSNDQFAALLKGAGMPTVEDVDAPAESSTKQRITVSEPSPPPGLGQDTDDEIEELLS